MNKTSSIATGAIESATTVEAPPATATRQVIPYNYLLSIGLVGLAVLCLNWDSTLSHPDNVKSVPGDLRKFIGLSEIFAHGFGVLVISLVLWLLVPNAARFIPRIAMCAFWPSLIVNGLKLQFYRWRPIRFFDEFSVSHFPADQSETWLGWFAYDKWNMVYATQSFPSAHTATAWGLAIGMSWAFPKGRWLFFGIALLASVQRVISFAHWPSDVLVGAAIAFCFAGALTQNWGVGKWLSRLESHWDHSKPSGDQTLQN
ncbi:MAG: phosphatase PAP2 family protein [Planctomycetota bacterium]